MSIKEPILTGLGILIIGTLLLTALDSLFTYPAETPEYQAGYQAGYSEQNLSKYHAAQNLTSYDGLFIPFTSDQLHYAKGYTSGYNQKLLEESLAIEENNYNYSLEILGI